MCTILLAWRCLEKDPFVLAGNRDEFVGRPSTAPTVLGERPRVVGGRDGRSGGTWMAVAADGRIALVTNRLTSSFDETRRSRGELPLATLEISTPAATRRFFATLDATAYNPFNLMFVSGEMALVGHWDGESNLRVVELDPGFHVLTLHDVDDTQQAKVTFLHDELSASTPTLPTSDSVLREMERLLRDHGDGARTDLDCVCVHGEGYGTISSSSVVVRASGKVGYRHAPGPPCRIAFDDKSCLFDHP